MKKGLKLSPTILDRFASTREPFAILDSRIYTIEKESPISNGDCWECAGGRFALFESDELRVFRNSYFEDDREKIQGYMSWVIDFKLRRRVETLAKEVSGKCVDYYSKLKRQSLDQFLIDIFNIFSHKRDIEVNLEDAEEEINVDTSIDSYPSIEQLYPLDTQIYNIISRPGVLVVNGMCYQLRENLPISRHGTINFKGRKYNLIPLIGLDKLSQEYRIQLVGRIEEVALQHGSKFSEQIDMLNSKSKEYEEKIVGGESDGGVTRKVGNIGYEPMEDNDYLIYAEIEPYILEKNGRYYVFNDGEKEGSKKVEVGTVLTISSGSVIIQGAPMVLNMPYFHPFVYDNGSICYDGGQDRWAHHDIKFLPHQYSLGQNGLARKVATLLWEADMNITQGYLGQNPDPVYRLSRFNSIAQNESDAKAYARSHGIDERRIFKN